MNNICLLFHHSQTCLSLYISQSSKSHSLPRLDHGRTSEFRAVYPFIQLTLEYVTQLGTQLPPLLVSVSLRVPTGTSNHSEGPSWVRLPPCTGWCPWLRTWLPLVLFPYKHPRPYLRRWTTPSVSLSLVFWLIPRISQPSLLLSLGASAISKW